MKHSRLSLCIAPLLLVGCVTIDPEPAKPVGPCGAAELQYLVGQPGPVLDGMRFSQDLRVIRPRMPVTMDHRPDRLNILLDDQDVIVRVSCG